MPTFLLLDDDPAEHDLMGFMLTDAFEDAEVVASADPRGAVEACQARAFDCVFVDYNMPHLDGLTCGLQIHAALPYLPVILTTGAGDEMLAARAVGSGISDYLPKSRTTPDLLRQTVLRATRSAEQAQIIDEQRRELENFAHALAHDFRQPIRQIRTFTDLIGEAFQEGRTVGVDQHLTHLDGAARRLATLVDMMGRYTLLGRTPEIEDVDLNAVLDEVRRELVAYLEECGGRLIAGPAPVVRGNAALMSQVLQNLIVNGLKYNESPTPIVMVTYAPNSETCVIKVEDNGIGIPADYHAEIFRPLVRLHPRGKYPGTGLGLTLARKALAAQGGAIWCESEPGAGSEFFIRMPVSGAAAATLDADLQP
ncbi:MAG: response regulator [Phenylobacterium sp.]|uniref:hybrid sensor histidine kinase/response regulator n=1 Tax=Phenylobacterium sp. TaxID=1871053 RepID=UPI0025D63125|nr:hybrid sensor histidine kinase/response regulator [Phenylobacterium sp.]MBI1200419.1 response regulator [Phenylobacterium sp.]